MESLEPFVATSYLIYQKVSVDFLQGRHWGLAASRLLGCHGNHCAPMLAAAVSMEKAQGICWHDRMVWAVFLPQVPGLALVRSTRARPPVPILDLGGYLFGMFGGPISVWVSN